MSASDVKRCKHLSDVFNVTLGFVGLIFGAVPKIKDSSDMITAMASPPDLPNVTVIRLAHVGHRYDRKHSYLYADSSGTAALSFEVWEHARVRKPVR